VESRKLPHALAPAFEIRAMVPSKRSLRANMKMTAKDIAEKFECSITTVNKIRSGRYYKEIL
jgi:DNA-binding XRE family transcriptional regulator